MKYVTGHRKDCIDPSRGEPCCGWGGGGVGHDDPRRDGVAGGRGDGGHGRQHREGVSADLRPGHNIRGGPKVSRHEGQNICW